MSSSYDYLNKVSGLSVAAYSSQYSTSNAASMAIDGNTSSYWRCDTPTGAYLTILLSAAHAVDKIRIYITSSTYYPTNWTLYGSNDGVAFTGLLTSVGASTTGWQEFIVTNSTSYLYYKWVCNTGNSTRLYITEIELWETLTYTYAKSDGARLGIKFTQPLVGDVSGLTPAPVGGIDYSKVNIARSSISVSSVYNDSYTGQNTVDGDTTTYWYGTAAVSWILYKFLKPFALKKLRIYMASYYVTSFTISGSKDGISYTQIGGTLTGASSSTGQWYEYILDNAIEYSYYRINTLTAYSSRVYLYEVEMYKYGPIGNEKYFTITGNEYDFVPNGALSQKEYQVVSVSTHPMESNSLLLEIDDFSRFCSVAGDITIAYSGGNLMGEGGAVAGFSVTFSPLDLIPKPHQNDQERIDIAFAVSATLLRIYYTEVQHPGEHIEVINISSNGVLTNINDL